MNHKHAELVGRGLRWLQNTKGCNVVVSEMGSGYEIPDVIGWNGWASVLLEAKATVADFKADLNKTFRHDGGPKGMGLQRYYIVPNEIKDKILELMPPKWGLLAVGVSSVYVIRESEAFEGRSMEYEMEILVSIIRMVARTEKPLKGFGVKYYIPMRLTDDPKRELFVEPIIEVPSNCHELHRDWMKLYNFCPECGLDVRKESGT